MFHFCIFFLKIVKQIEGETVIGIAPTTMREVSILSHMHHPNVIEMREAIFEAVTPSFLLQAIVLEKCDMDLHAFLRKLSTKLPPFAVQVSASLFY